MRNFNEIGLAEYSPNHPLKVINSKLEFDETEENKNKVDFRCFKN